MAPMKFEENIKERLDGREIKPSADAWERINAQLENDKSRKRKPSWFWLAVAAGFVGILILAGNFFKTSPQAQGNPAVTISTTTDAEKKEGNLNQIPIKEDKTILVDNDKPYGENKTKTSKTIDKNHKKGKITDADLSIKPTKTALTEAGKTTETPEKTTPKTEVFKDELLNTSIDAEINALLARVDSLKQSNHQVTDTDIDALLAQAQEKIVNEHRFIEPNKSLSATALLQEVEGELDNSFRDEIFNALKAGYIKTREAIASRND